MAEALEKTDMSDQGAKEQIEEMTEGHGQDEEQMVAVAEGNCQNKGYKVHGEKEFCTCRRQHRL